MIKYIRNYFAEVSGTKKIFTEYDSYLFHEGTHRDVYRKLGAHQTTEDGKKGTHFALWAPNARSVKVMTGRNGWDASKGIMSPSSDGIWECFVPAVRTGDSYRYVVEGADDITRMKSDPYTFFTEFRPANASVVWPLSSYVWHDRDYRKQQSSKKATERPMAIYEVHLGSWKKDYSRGEDGYLDYRTLADQLCEYVEYMGYTHVELMGICEHPFDGSWGYQVTGYYSPTSRYGSPDDFRYLVDKLHTHGIGVILDWVPAHFPKDTFGLECFDGTPLYEYADPLRSEYPEWGTKAFDHGRPEVKSFFISNAFYWINEFHVDALRVDAVAAMLYNSFSRTEWRPNIYGGTENLESMAFLKELNGAVRKHTKGYLIAEDSSIIEGITRPVEEGGFGFLFKWNMGWMNDTLKYVEKEPVYRGWHHGNLTHSAEYAFLENFVLVLSHDEVVYGKRPMLMKFPGAMGDKFGGLKTLYTYMFTHPGKKLLFMGQDFADDAEWSEKKQINWGLADDEWHRDVMDTVRRLLSAYRKYPVLYTDSGNPVTFEWVNAGDCFRNTVSYIRRNPWNYNSALLVICNFSPINYGGYTCGVPLGGWYKRIFSTFDSLPYQGSSFDIPPLTAQEHPCDGRPFTLSYDLRPYESVIFEFPINE